MKNNECKVCQRRDARALSAGIREARAKGARKARVEEQMSARRATMVASRNGAVWKALPRSLGTDIHRSDLGARIFDLFDRYDMIDDRNSDWRPSCSSWRELALRMAIEFQEPGFEFAGASVEDPIFPGKRIGSAKHVAAQMIQERIRQGVPRERSIRDAYEEYLRFPVDRWKPSYSTFRRAFYDYGKQLNSKGSCIEELAPRPPVEDSLLKQACLLTHFEALCSVGEAISKEDMQSLSDYRWLFERAGRKISSEISRWSWKSELFSTDITDKFASNIAQLTSDDRIEPELRNDFLNAARYVAEVAFDPSKIQIVPRLGFARDGEPIELTTDQLFDQIGDEPALGRRRLDASKLLREFFLNTNLWRDDRDIDSVTAQMDRYLGWIFNHARATSALRSLIYVECVSRLIGTPKTAFEPATAYFDTTVDATAVADAEDTVAKIEWPKKRRSRNVQTSRVRYLLMHK